MRQRKPTHHSRLARHVGVMRRRLAISALSLTLGILLACVVPALAAWRARDGIVARNVPSVQADGGAPNLAYVAGAGADGQGLAVIDINQRGETRYLAVGGTPAGVVLSQDSRYAFVSRRARDQIAVVDTSSLRVLRTIPVGRRPTALAYDVNQSLLYVANSGSNTVSVVNPATFTVTHVIAVGAAPSGLAIAAANSGITAYDDEELYVANAGDASISIYSIRRQRVIATIPLPSDPAAVVIPSVGGVAYVTTSAGAVLALSLSAHRLLGVLWQSAGARLGVMDYDAVTGVIYVPDASANTVVALTPAGDSGNQPPRFPSEPARTLTFAGTPVSVAITFEGAYGFVAERDAGRVAMFDATTRQTLGVVAVGGAPVAIVTGAYPPLLTQQGATLADALGAGAILLIMLAALTSLLVEIRRQRRRRSARTTSERIKGSAS
ncbi:MAG TPA: beta-propeller fold lactonase family protein [Ktedonobacterales bacterium]|jgi:YVTN family beta-propeller protein